MTAADADAVLKRIRLKLPPAATVEYASYVPGQDDAARLRLLMPEADWRAFRAELDRRTPHPPEYSADANFLLGPAQGDWNPAAARGLTTGQLQWGDVEGLNVGYAPADGGRVRVFILWHQT